MTTTFPEAPRPDSLTSSDLPAEPVKTEDPEEYFLDATLRALDRLLLRRASAPPPAA